jgi:hypothetical protein
MGAFPWAFLCDGTSHGAFELRQGREQQAASGQTTQAQLDRRHQPGYDLGLLPIRQCPAARSAHPCCQLAGFRDVHAMQKEVMTSDRYDTIDTAPKYTFNS